MEVSAPTPLQEQSDGTQENVRETLIISEQPSVTIQDEYNEEEIIRQLEQEIFSDKTSDEHTDEDFVRQVFVRQEEYSKVQQVRSSPKSGIPTFKRSPSPSRHSLPSPSPALCFEAAAAAAETKEKMNFLISDKSESSLWREDSKSEKDEELAWEVNISDVAGHVKNVQKETSMLIDSIYSKICTKVQQHLSSAFVNTIRKIRSVLMSART